MTSHCGRWGFSSSLIHPLHKHTFPFPHPTNSYKFLFNCSRVSHYSWDYSSPLSCIETTVSGSQVFLFPGLLPCFGAATHPAASYKRMLFWEVNFLRHFKSQNNLFFVYLIYILPGHRIVDWKLLSLIFKSLCIIF